MAAVSQCPDAQQLQRLLLGHLADETASRLEEHVERCPHCSRLLPTLQAEDALVAAMRAQGRVAVPVDRRALDGLISRLQHLQPAQSDAFTMALDGDASGLLSPPQGPGEMGRLGPYRVVRLLGKGGMGMVFEAEDVHLQRAVALKAMRPDIAQNASARERFLREARATANIEHDHIVTIYQVGEDRGVPYLAMQLLKGLSLEDYLRKKQPGLPVDRVLRIGREIARGLAAAHARGLIHRDIKPANIWLDTTAGGRVKILDFGLARAADGDGQLTQSGVIVGTATYMAPEQARGEKVDARADLFSLGCVLYRLATGRLPWKGDDVMSTLVAIASEPPPPVQQFNAELPPRLAGLIMQLLAKNPDDRPPSAEAVVEALQAIEREQNTMLMTRALPVAAPVFAGGGAEQSSTATALAGPIAPRAVPATTPRRQRGRRLLLSALAAALLFGGLIFWAISGKHGNTEAPSEGSRPGSAAAAERSLPGGLWGRRGALRERLLREGGGTSASEAAVAAGLRWLADHQGPQGDWNLADFAARCNCGDATAHDTANRDIAGTGLVLLAFLGAGQTHKPSADNPHAPKIEAGVKYLLSKQQKDGSLGANYAHAINTLALCEALALTDDPALRDPAQRAINFAVAYQHDAGGFKYEPRMVGDLSVTTWFLRAFKSAELAGLHVPPAALRKIGHFVDSVATPDGSGYCYMKEPSQPPRLTMTASGVLCRQELSPELRPAALAKALESLRQQPPQASFKQIYYYYHATPALYNFGGKPWDDWNAKMRDLLVDTQDKGTTPGRGHRKGSWLVAEDTMAKALGRMGYTALAIMTLEVYYRYQPLNR
jgi:tRNA A-37 threonylcarbamoyl transferase component Bud32